MFSSEIPLLVKQSDIPHVPLFDSSQLHVNTTFVSFCSVLLFMTDRFNWLLILSSVDPLFNHFFHQKRIKLATSAYNFGDRQAV